MAGSIGVPTAHSFGTSFKSYGYGLAAGFLSAFLGKFIGSGFLGSLVVPVAAGAMLKGPEGVAISAVSGYSAGQILSVSGLGNIFGKKAAADSTGSEI